MDAPRESKSSKRIKAEYSELKLHPHNGIKIDPSNENNVYEWSFNINGPPGTAYEGTVLPGTLIFPKDYPLLPPKVRLVGQVFHPNVAPDGTVEIPILHVTGDDPSRHDSAQERWSPVQSVEKILLAVRGMFVRPFEENIANPQADDLLKTDKEKFVETVKQSVSMFAAL
ncbi:Ubiquitin-conjugating enzyme E2 G2 [Linnemannia schmuckeri]|uniref:Ubiquitin-conjugating enzyme E2 G2 n=1 Tax=Linnemannia schmuckeri TaxID=64567 RepID=A0A9P5S1J3_9FUNG|nr:Ubiquitin-conjugating enzyme E2 G2 [Linnemannia schmuckeri]